MTHADIFNVGLDVKAPDGTVYKLRQPTQYEQGEFQRWLEQRAHDAVDRSTDSEERKDRRHHRIDVDAGLGMYEWESQYALEALWTPAGLIKLVAITCREQGVTDERAEEVVRHSFKEVAAKMMRQRATDPKRFALALEVLGLPSEWAACEPDEPSSSNSSTRPSTAPSPNSADSATTNSSSSTPSSAAPTG